jgi:hypothetical protein
MVLDTLHTHISGQMFGRIGMTPAETVLLGKTVATSQKHLELGTLWGGTAILAALAGAKQVYSLDKMSGGWWADGRDPKVNHPLGPKAVIDNLAKFNLQSRVALVIALSEPFPLTGMVFDTALVDGGHTLEAVRADWANLHPLVSEAILFHDYDDLHLGVKQFLDSGQVEADGWELLEQVDTLRVYLRKIEKETLHVEATKEPETLPDGHHPNDPTPDAVPTPKSSKSKRAK